MPVGNPGETFGRGPKDAVLLVRERVVGFVGVGHVGRQALDFDGRQYAEAFGKSDGGIEF